MRANGSTPVKRQNMLGRAVTSAGPLGRVALALLVGAVGGALAFTVNFPLAWMMGAMLATTVVAVAGVPIQMYAGFRAIMVAVLGVMLGSSFEPAMLERVVTWSLSLSMLLFYVALSGCVGLWFFRRVAGYDPITAYFSGMPGGLSEMVLTGGAMGGDERVISLTHASRILIVVVVIPFAFRWFHPAAPASVLGPNNHVSAEALDLLILGLCGVVGYACARLMRLPAAALVGPMVLSGVVHLAGLTAARPPVELSAAAQVVVGTAIGCRFAGTRFGLIVRALRYAAGGTALLLSVTMMTAGLLHWVTGLPFASLVLAFSPGGLAEMSLIAFALDVDPAFVATHHVVRIFLVVVFAPLAFRVWRPPR